MECQSPGLQRGVTITTENLLLVDQFSSLNERLVQRDFRIRKKNKTTTRINQSLPGSPMKRPDPTWRKSCLSPTTMSPKQSGSAQDQGLTFSNHNESRTTRKSTNFGHGTQLGFVSRKDTVSLFDSSIEQRSPLKQKTSDSSVVLRGPNRIINGYVNVGRSQDARPSRASSESSICVESSNSSCGGVSIRVG